MEGPLLKIYYRSAYALKFYRLQLWMLMKERRLPRNQKINWAC